MSKEILPIVVNACPVCHSTQALENIGTTKSFVDSDSGDNDMSVWKCRNCRYIALFSNVATFEPEVEAKAEPVVMGAAAS